MVCLTHKIYDRLGPDAAPDVKRATNAGRTETLVVTTRPDGSTEVQILDGLGKPKSIDSSLVLKIR